MNTGAFNTSSLTVIALGTVVLLELFVWPVISVREGSALHPLAYLSAWHVAEFHVAPYNNSFCC